MWQVLKSTLCTFNGCFFSTESTLTKDLLTAGTLIQMGKSWFVPAFVIVESQKRGQDIIKTNDFGHVPQATAVILQSNEFIFHVPIISKNCTEKTTCYYTNTISSTVVHT